jgi:uncharacterized protein with FMN-binding domain
MRNEPDRPAFRDPLLDRLAKLPAPNQPPFGRRSPTMPLARTATPPPPHPTTAAAKSAAVRAATGRSIAPKKKHPARAARIAALALSCATTGGLAFWFSDINATQAATTALAALPAPIATTGTTAAPMSTPLPAASLPAASLPAATTPPIAAPVPATTIKAPVAAVQAFNGRTVNTEYGPVQVQVQFTNGALSDVAVVQYPNSDGKSVRISSQALPQLRAEALTAQGARVRSISGATYTSAGYTKSLQSAIDQARAAGATTMA